MRIRLLVAITLFCTTCAFASPMALVNLDNRQLAALDLVNGNLSGIGFTPNGLTGLAWSASLLYGVDTAGELVTINPATAAVTPIGNTGVTFTVFGGLTSGALFGVDYGNNLYSINPTTAAATSIGPTGLPAIHVGDTWANGLAGDAGDLYYVYQVSGSNTVASSLYRLNLLTGAASLIGPTGADDIEGAGLIAATLYGFAAGSHQILTLNTVTGAAIVVGPYQSTAALYGAVPEAGAVPEPGTISLMIAGLLGVLTAAWKRRPLSR